MGEFQNIISETIENPKEFLERLGFLHDARIEKLEWFPENKLISIFVDDLNSNFLDLPEYEGLTPALLNFNGVDNVVLDVDKCDNHLNIYELIATASPSILEIKIKFWPSGFCNFQCESIDIRKNMVQA